MKAIPCIPTGLACAAVLLGGCALAPPQRSPGLALPSHWAAGTPVPESQPAGPTTRPFEALAWWRLLNDPMLNSLIRRATASNLDLRLAEARLREARAARGLAAADLWPQVNVAGSYAYRGTSFNSGPRLEGGASPAEQFRNNAVNSALRSLTRAAGGATDPPAAGTTPAGIVAQAISSAISNRLAGDGPRPSRDQNLFLAGFDAIWELDLFGGRRRAVEAADAEIAAAQEDRRAVLVTLLSEIALNYVQLRGFQRRLAIARENIQLQQDTVALTRERFEAGFASKLDLTQAQTQLASTRSQVPLFRAAIRQAIYQLSVLLAQPPGALLKELEQEGPLPAPTANLSIGLPSELLRRRPDIRAAERRLAAATARTAEAIADLFPRFSLTGSIGPQSRTMRHLLDARSLTWSVGPALSWPLFEGGRIRSNIQVQDARQEQAVTAYEQTVLTAFQEVENALTAYVEEQLRSQALLEAVRASRESVALSNELFAKQWTNFLSVLESQRALYASQDQLVQSQTAVVTNLIALYKALGGGWQVPEETAGP